MAIEGRPVPTLDAIGVNPFEDKLDSAVWLEMLDLYRQQFKNYMENCDTVDSLYTEIESGLTDIQWRKLQVFWANMEVMKPTIYSRAPKPVVSGRFRDRRDLTREAGVMLERAITASFELEDIHETMKLLRDQFLMYSRAVPWVRFSVEGSKECVKYDVLDRHDFAHEVSRSWPEVGWVARRAWLTRPVIRERFSETYEKLHDSPLDMVGIAFTRRPYDIYETDNDESDHNAQYEDEGTEESIEEKAQVWELWHKEQNVVVWVTQGVEKVLDIREPYLTLEGFFPCPKPLFGTLRPATLRPIPDANYYIDQLNEINILTERIGALADALKMKGFYTAGMDSLSDAVENALKATDQNAVMIPVPNAAELGGAQLANAIVWLPIREVAETVANLVTLRSQMIQDVYQVTGISDIMRGSTDPNETLGAQNLKGQYGSIRVRTKQEEMQRIGRDLTNMSGEIMAEEFSEESLLLMSQYDKAPRQAEIDQQIMGIESQLQQAAASPQGQQMLQQNPQQAQQIIQQAQAQVGELQETVTIEKIIALFRDEKVRPFVLDIETDSTITPDEQRDKENVNEFLAALTKILTILSQMVGADPETAPFAAEVLLFAVKPYRVGRSLIGAIESFAENIEKKAGAGDPEAQAAQEAAQQAQMAAIQAELEKTKAETQKVTADAAKSGAEAQKTQAETQQIALGAPQAQEEGDPVMKEAETELLAENNLAEFDQLELGRARLEQDKLKLSNEAEQLRLDRAKIENEAFEIGLDGAENAPIKAPIDRLADAVRQSTEITSAKLEQLAEAVSEQSEVILEAHKATMAPKRILRDEQGRVTGAETVLPQ